jgi:CRP/FNR family transcriptional regulator/CRP/FNR family cyclic AMP-dependent transcriptional regulator
LSSIPGSKYSPVELFETIPLFKGLGEEELKSIANSSKEISFQTGNSIVKEGDAGLGFYVILDGQAVVKRRGKSLSKLGRGSFFGEMALLDDQPRSADVVATEPTKCLVLLRWNFWSLVSKNQKIARGLLEEMARRLRTTNEALSE